jgi:hypothetical protein
MTIHGMTCDSLDGVLADYLEGALDDSAVADVELHLAACARCRGLVHDLEQVTRDAARLPALAPSQDLWPVIAARLETPVVALAPRPRAVASAWGRRTRLGAIAAALVAVTAGVTYELTVRQAAVTRVASAPLSLPAADTPRAVETVPALTGGTAAVPRSPSPDSAPEAGRVGATPGTTGTVTVARRPQLDAVTTFDGEIARLHSVLTEREDDLDPATVAILRNSLTTIDRAIAEARTALALDPASRFLTDQLNKALERKLGVLRTVALLPSRT